uniref:Aminotransferase-like plant mobile domain-containing protein n=1 Tax=Fagus sylvatica TaxID=28930 RepID=A0A2N9FHL4_FAGSY
MGPPKAPSGLLQMSDRGSGSGGHRRSDRLAKGKAVIYARDSSPDTDDEYDAMEDVRTRADASIARNLQAELDAEAAGLAPFPRITLRRDFRYPPQGGIRPRYPVAVEISDTPLLTNLLAHPSSLVRRCQDPPESVGRGGWSEFSKLLAISRREYREFLTELGFGPFLGIPYVSVYHPSAPPSEPIPGDEALAILGLDGLDAIDGKKLPSVRVRYLADVLRRDREEPPTELRYRQWAAYFIFSCFLGNDKSTVPTPIVGMFRDIDALRDRLPLASDPDFPLARRWDSSRIRRMTTRTLLELRMTVDCIRDAEIVFQPYSAALTQRPEVFRAVELSHLRIWIRSPRSWELLLAERTLRQLGGEAVVPVDPSPLMTIEGYIPRAPSDPYVAGVSVYPGLVREDVPYQEWFERVSLGIPDVSSRGRDGQYADGGDTARGGDGTDAADLAQRQRDLDSRDAEVARLAATVRRLEEQLQGMGITPVTGAGLVWSWSDFFFATS